MWTWDEAAGELRRNGKLVTRGYAGKGRGRSKPTLQGLPSAGPLPAGRWRMTALTDSPNTGADTIVLEPVTGTDPRGLASFRVHGDSIANPGAAARGCIILPQSARRAMWQSGDRLLEVVAPAE